MLGVATCDKGLPAMMMALAGDARPAVRARARRRDAAADARARTPARCRSIGARFAHGEITLEEAAELGCRACATPGGGCQFLGTAATSQVVGEALGHVAAALRPGPVGPADLARHGPPLGPGAGRSWPTRGLTTRDILTDAAVRNAMAVHAAFGGSTNLLLHIPAIAYAAGLRRPTVEDWTDVNRQVPRLVDVLPNGPVGHPTVRVFLAGGVPEVMLHLRAPGPARRLDCLTVTGEPLGRRARLVGDSPSAGTRLRELLQRTRRRRSRRRHHEPRAGAASAA